MCLFVGHMSVFLHYLFMSKDPKHLVSYLNLCTLSMLGEKIKFVIGSDDGSCLVGGY